MSNEVIDAQTGEVFTSREEWVEHAKETWPEGKRELVPVENIHTLNELTPQAREFAVTRMLSEARSWLAHAVEATDPQSIATFKAQMATVAEATKQLNLSKGIQLDALEMVRRAERGVGLAIRKGQAEGAVRRHGEGSKDALSQLRGHATKLSPVALAPHHELHGARGDGGIYAMTDGVTDDQFENAIDAAKDEGNLSRANVVRKVRGAQGGVVETRTMRADKIRTMAAQGHTRDAIATAVGIGPQAVVKIAKDYGIEIPADVVMSRRRRADSPELLDRAVATVETISQSITHINPSDLDPTEAREQIDSLIRSLNAIRKAANQIKESL